MEIGYTRGNYGEVIEVILNDGDWILKSLFEDRGEVIKVDKTRVYDTPFEAISGKRKKVKKFSNKKAVFSTFIEQTSAKEKGE